MGRLAVRLLGKFAAYSDSQPLHGLEVRKLQEFLAYLLLHRNHTFNREALAELISPEAAPEQSRKGLRQVLWQLQSVVNESLDPQQERLILVDADWIALNGNADVWLDVAEIELAFAKTVGQPGETLDEEAANMLCQAVALYRGDLLEGWYQDWCLLERERVQNCFLAMLDKLMAYNQAHGEYERGLVYGGQILRYDRARERTHARLMQLYWLAGDRTAALRQYHACAVALKEELDAQPSRRTTSLYEQILHDDPRAPLPALSSAGTNPLSELLQQVKLSFATLLDLQLQVANQVSELQRLLDTNG